MIRKAELKDAKAIHKLIDYYAKRNVMLPRTMADLCERIRDFWVYEEGRVLGCAALCIYSDDLAEIRSMAVDKAVCRRGIGTRLLKACVEEAKSLGIKEVFALTLAREFFRKAGFKRIDRRRLPQKIWGECLACAKFAKCDETAYIKGCN